MYRYSGKSRKESIINHAVIEVVYTFSVAFQAARYGWEDLIPVF